MPSAGSCSSTSRNLDPTEYAEAITDDERGDAEEVIDVNDTCQALRYPKVGSSYQAARRSIGLRLVFGVMLSVSSLSTKLRP